MPVVQGCKPRIRAPRAVLLISELEPASSHLRVPVCVCTARPHHDSVPQCARLTRCVQLLTFFVLHASPPTPRLPPPPHSHTVDTSPVTAKLPPLVATQSLRPKTHESPTDDVASTCRLEKPLAHSTWHTSHTAPRKSALFIQVPLCKLFLSPFALDHLVSILL